MKTIILTLLLPLGLVLAGIGVAAVLSWKNRRVGASGWMGRSGPMFMAAVFLFGYIVSTPAFGGALGRMLFNHVEGKALAQAQDADLIIVLTAGIWNAGPTLGWMPKPQSIQRLASGYELQRLINIRLPVIVSGGYTEGVNAPSEAKVAAEFFAKNRTELTPTELEEVSTDTFESALQLAPVIAKRGAKNVILVTSDTHMLRALAFYRARGIDAIPAPVLTIPSRMGVRGYLPSVTGLSLTSDAVYEIYALALALTTGRINFSDLSYNPQPQQGA